MLPSLAALGLAALASLAASVSAQTVTPIRELSLEPFPISPRFCTKTETGEVFYDALTLQPVKQYSCGGMCLSLISQPNTCQVASTRYRLVYTTPYADPANRRYIKFVESCGCKGKQCEVNGRTYDHGRTVYNSCEEKCECSYGNLVNCCRQRMEWTTMTTSQKTRYINAYKLASSTTAYKDLIDLHYDEFYNGIHSSAHFLPWHRWYIFELENLLRDVSGDCRVTQPWWDWSRAAATPFSNNPALTPWQTDSSYGFGDGGSTCVTNGAFASPGWAQADGTCLRRSFNGVFPGATQVASVLSQASFASFRPQLEGVLHNTAHVRIGADMSSRGSATAPEFFLHHTYIDELWSRWQGQAPANLMDYSGGALTDNIVGNTDGYTVNDFMRLDQHPDNVRVCYVRRRRFVDIIDVLVAPAALEKIQFFPRIPMSTVPDEERKMMQIGDLEWSLLQTAIKVDQKYAISAKEIDEDDYIGQANGIPTKYGLEVAEAYGIPLSPNETVEEKDFMLAENDQASEESVKPILVTMEEAAACATSDDDDTKTATAVKSTSVVAVSSAGVLGLGAVVAGGVVGYRRRRNWTAQTEETPSVELTETASA